MAENERQLVFNDHLENVLRPHLPLLSKQCIERLKNEAGVDVTAKLKLHYQRENFERTLKVLAEEVYPELSLEKATQKLGEDLIEPFQHSVLGKAIMGVVRLLPLRSSLKRLPGYLKSGNSYVEATVVQHGDDAYDLIINEMGSLPYYWVGVMVGGNRVLGYHQSTTTLVAYDGHQGTLRIQLK